MIYITFPRIKLGTKAVQSEFNYVQSVGDIYLPSVGAISTCAYKE